MLFDVVVLGRDPAGWEVALHAAELGQRVAVVDDPQHFERTNKVETNWQIPEAIQKYSGLPRFVTSELLEVIDPQHVDTIQSRRFVLACGSRAKRPSHIVFDGQQILDSDEIGNLEPTSQPWLVVGAGDHGLNAARQLIAQGARVSIVDQYSPMSHASASSRMPSTWDAIRKLECPVHWGTTILGAEHRRSSVTVYHENGSIETYRGVVFAVGRLGCTSHLRLPRPDLLLDETQRVWCNEFGQTGMPHIYAVGSVVGFPRPAGSHEQQAARVIRHLFQEEVPTPHLIKPRIGSSLVAPK